MYFNKMYLFSSSDTEWKKINAQASPSLHSYIVELHEPIHIGKKGSPVLTQTVYNIVFEGFFKITCWKESENFA